MTPGAEPIALGPSVPAQYETRLLADDLHIHLPMCSRQACPFAITTGKVHSLVGAVSRDDLSIIILDYV
jgi:hypothetical protein